MLHANNIFVRASLIALLIPLNSWGCATCGCSLNTDAAIGYSTHAGWQLNFQFDYLNQDTLRTGRRGASQVPQGSELQNDTLTRTYTAGITYLPNANWSLSLKAPYIIRAHSTYGNYDASQPLPALSESHSSSIGDVKLILSYQGILPTHNLGVQIGLKLPTGQFGDATHFVSGPYLDTPLDTSLQAGTGSTDLIAGAYFLTSLGDSLDMVATGQMQRSIKQHLDQPGNDYRPGDSQSATFGLRYVVSPQWVPQLQINLTHKNSESGARADTVGSAGSVAYLSPGIAIKATDHARFYAFAQIPIYSNLSGYQIFSRYALSVGTSYAF